jgi:ATP-dependent Lon protease
MSLIPESCLSSGADFTKNSNATTINPNDIKCLTGLIESVGSGLDHFKENTFMTSWTQMEIDQIDQETLAEQFNLEELGEETAADTHWQEPFVDPDTFFESMDASLDPESGGYALNRRDVARIALFNNAQVEAKIALMESMRLHDDMFKKDSDLLKVLTETRGPWRALVPPAPSWSLALDKLHERFPAFSEVITYVRGACAIAQFGTHVPQLQPMLFVGPAGVGKSYFASELAAMLSVPAHTVQLNAAQTNASLSGSSTFWSNAAPGLIFKQLVYQGVANPLFILEEIDKITGASQYDPSSSLYQILEPATAAAFEDQCYDWLTIDASHVSYVCTANRLEDIPEPIISRLRVFSIEPLDDNSMIVERILTQVLEEMPEPLKGIRLADDAKTLFVDFSPRMIRNVIKQAIGRAVVDGRTREILPKDLKNIGSATRKKPGSIGFL